MAQLKPLLACAGLALLLGGCATFGTNVEGDFSCRAPKGECAPSHVIDAAATSVIDGRAENRIARVRTSVANDDTTRTSERKLRIVFPAHVDETGTLHDEAVAWTVVESPRWAAELRRRQGDDAAPPLMRQLKRQLRSAQRRAVTGDAVPDEGIAAAVAGEAQPEPDNNSPFSISAPPVSSSSDARRWPSPPRRARP